jgi:MEDS: MEthanogen/methylotroph, DcmR Sensory domain/Histidine kinase-like ATPase domain
VSAEFVRTGQRLGEPVLVAQRRPQLERLSAALGDPEEVTFLDMSVSGRNPGRILPWILHAFSRKHGGRQVRIIGEPIWPGRTSLEYPACLEHEALINYALRDMAVNVMCPYDITGLTVQMVRDAHLTHPWTMDRGGAVKPTAGFDEEELKSLLDQRLAPPPGDALPLTFTKSGLRLVRQLAGTVARANGMSAERTDDFTYAVNEAATNAVRHGGGEGTMRLWTEHDHLAADVHSAIPLADPVAGRLHPDPTAASARGLPLINHLCDLVRWSGGDDGTRVRMWMRLGA